MGSFALFLGARTGSGAEGTIIRVGTLLVGNGIVVRNAVIVTEGRTLIYAGPSYLYAPDGAKDRATLDFPKGVAVPGFIAADAVMRVGKTRNEEMSECTPAIDLLDSIDPDADDLNLAWKSGVTSVYLAPGADNVIAGRGCVLKTRGRTPREMLVENDLHLRIVLGNGPNRGNSYNRYGDGFTMRTRRPKTRMGGIALIRESLFNAMKKMDLPDSRLTADELVLRRALKGEIPVRFRAASYLDIEAAFRIVKEFKGIRWILEDGVDAYRFLDELKTANIPVIYGPVYKQIGGVNFNRQMDHYEADTPLGLDNNGILLAFRNDETTSIGALRDEAILAVSLGMGRDRVLAALTINPARILGLDKRLGTIEKGKDADILIFDGDPFSPASRLEKVIIDGKAGDPHE